MWDPLLSLFDQDLDITRRNPMFTKLPKGNLRLAYLMTLSPKRKAFIQLLKHMVGLWKY